MTRVLYLRVQKGSAGDLTSQGWQLVKETRKSKVYAKIDAGGGNVEMANGSAAAGDPQPALNQDAMNELAALLGGMSFAVGAQAVQNQEQAEAVVQAVVQGVQSEEDVFAGLMSGLKMGGRRRRGTKKGRKSKKKGTRSHK